MLIIQRYLPELTIDKTTTRILFYSEKLITFESKAVTMRNWLAGIIAVAGLVFFFFIEKNLVGFIVLIACAVAAAILFSEREMDERVKRMKEEEKRRKRKTDS